MLVLSRKRNQAIVIDNNIRIVVVEIGSDKVRLGIEAPATVKVMRQEISSTELRQSDRDAPSE